jgi:hypothetical protein
MLPGREMRPVLPQEQTCVPANFNDSYTHQRSLGLELDLFRNRILYGIYNNA